MFDIQFFEEQTQCLNQSEQELLENVLGKENPIVERLLNEEGK